MNRTGLKLCLLVNTYDGGAFVVQTALMLFQTFLAAEKHEAISHVAALHTVFGVVQPTSMHIWYFGVLLR